MDAISYSHSVKQEKRIKKFIANPDSNSGIVTQPKVIAAGESVKIKSGRQAILANTVIDGDLVIEAGGDVFIPAGAGFGDLDQRIDTLDIKINELQTLPIGAILNGYTIFYNCIVAFGGEFNRADYPKLWAYLQANPSLVKTQTQWQTEATANDGICGFYSEGNGTTTFRVPNLNKAFLRPDNRGVGSFQEGSYATGDHNMSLPAAICLVNFNDEVAQFRSRMNWDNISTVPMGATNLKAAWQSATDTGSFQTMPTLFGVSRPKNIAVLPLIVAK